MREKGDRDREKGERQREGRKREVIGKGGRCRLEERERERE